MLAVLAVGSPVLAMANYNDDTSNQSRAFDVGMAVFAFALIALVVTTVGAWIWMALSGRRRPRS